MVASEDADGNIDPIERLIEEAEVALESRMYSLALMGTLALVDICAALSSPNGETSGKKFVAWFEGNVAKETTRLDAADAYQLRCGLVHQGHVRGAAYDIIIFTLPDGSGNVYHGGIMEQIGGRPERVLNLDVRFFARDVLGAVARWWAVNRDVEPVASNAERLARVRPSGYPPFMVGMPVIA